MLVAPGTCPPRASPFSRQPLYAAIGRTSSRACDGSSARRAKASVETVVMGVGGMSGGGTGRWRQEQRSWKTSRRERINATQWATGRGPGAGQGPGGGRRAFGWMQYETHVLRRRGSHGKRDFWQKTRRSWVRTSVDGESTQSGVRGAEDCSDDLGLFSGARPVTTDASHRGQSVPVCAADRRVSFSEIAVGVLLLHCLVLGLLGGDDVFVEVPARGFFERHVQAGS